MQNIHTDCVNDKVCLLVLWIGFSCYARKFGNMLGKITQFCILYVTNSCLHTFQLLQNILSLELANFSLTI